MSKRKIIFLLSTFSLIVAALVFSYMISCYSFIDNYIYNGYSSEFVTDDLECIYTKSLSPEIVYKSTGTKYNFNLDPFSIDFKTPMYSDGKNIFYMSTDESGYSIGFYDSKFNSHYLLENKNRKTILPDGMLDNIFSSNSYLKMNEDYLNTPTQFVLVGKNIFLYCPGGVFKYNLLTHTKTKIFDGATGETSFSYANGYLFFQNSLYNFYVYDINKAIFIDDYEISAYSFCVNDEGVLYTDLDNQMHLTFLNFDTKEISIISDKEISAFDLDNEAIYYSINGTYYKSNFTGKEQLILGENKVCSILKKGTNNLYIVYDSNGDVKIEEVNFEK